MLCLRRGGGAPLIELPPQQLHSHHATVENTYHIAYISAFIIHNNENEHIENTCHIAFTPAFIIYNNENEHIEKHIT